LAKKAFITGITGQDGSYLADLLLSKGYEVHGLIRKSSSLNTSRVEHLLVDAFVPERKFFLYYGDLADSARLYNLINEIKPDEIYHFGGQTSGKEGFELPEYTGNINALGTVRLLEAIRRTGIKTKFCHASSFEMFGASPPPYNENTAFRPRSPSGAAKAYAYEMTVTYRESYKLFACNSIMFDHESPRRFETAPTRKTTRAIAHILAGKQKNLYLGTLDPVRDWGYAPEYVEAMWRMMQQEKAGDYVLGCGEGHAVGDWVKVAFDYVKMDVDKYLKKDDRPHATGGAVYTADAAKAKKELGWQPKVNYQELVKIMIDADMEAVGLKPPGEGKAILTKYNLNTIDRASGNPNGGLEEWPGLRKYNI
jgi:GDPmannose 4,6-dehydratase